MAKTLAGAKPKIAISVGDNTIYREIRRVNRLGRLFPFRQIHEANAIVARTHESPIKLYSLTFKPFNKTYNNLFNGIDHIRKKIAGNMSYESLIITREIYANKTHYNALIYTIDDAMILHDKHTNLYMIHVQQVTATYRSSEVLRTLRENIDGVFNYITKETKVRTFKKFIDYYVHDKYRPYTVTPERSPAVRPLFPCSDGFYKVSENERFHYGRDFNNN